MNRYQKDKQRLRRSDLSMEDLTFVRSRARAIWKAAAARRRADPEKSENDRKVRSATKKARRRDAKTWAIDRLPNLRAECARRGIPCTITAADVIVPSMCPVLGIPIVLGSPKGSDHLPNIDRKIPALGYVPGNVCVISKRANVLKSDSVDPEELRRVANYVEECVSLRPSR